MTCFFLECREIPPPDLVYGQEEVKSLYSPVSLPSPFHLKRDSLEDKPDTYRLSSSQRWGPCRRIWSARSPPRPAAVLRCCSHTWGQHWQIRWYNVQHPALSPAGRGNLQMRTQKAVSQQEQTLHHNFHSAPDQQLKYTSLSLTQHLHLQTSPAPLVKPSRITNPGQNTSLTFPWQKAAWDSCTGLPYGLNYFLQSNY